MSGIRIMAIAPLLCLLVACSALSYRVSLAAAPDATAAYDQFVQCFQNQSTLVSPADKIASIVISPTNPSYASTLQVRIKNKRFTYPTTPKPAFIVAPTNYSHVQAAVICAKPIGIQLKTRSGGHDYEGVSYVSNVPFFIVDMFNLNKVTISTADDTAWVQTGTLLGELQHAISKASLLRGFAAGVCPTVGVGGHLSSGGYGTMMRKFGLSVDNVVDALLVDVNGKLMDRKAMGEDLFWAIRGGGGASFGVILAYQIKLLPVPNPVTVFRVEKGLEENMTDLVFAWQNAMPKIDNDLFIRLVIQPTTSPVDKTKKSVKVTFIALFLGDAKRLMTVMQTGFPELGLKPEDCKEMSFVRSVMDWGNLDNSSAPEALLNRSSDTVKYGKRKSDYVITPIPKEGLDKIWQKMSELGDTGLVFNPYGGKMAEIKETETPFPHRAGILYKVQYSTSWSEEGPAAETDHMNQIRDLYKFMTPYVSSNPRQAFLAYRDLDIGINDHKANSFAQAQIYGNAYFKGNFDRLVKIKTTVDPDNFFKAEQSIPVLSKA